MSTKRVRLAAVTVQLTVYIDDGDTLEPAQVQPVSVPASEWAAFAATGVQSAVEDMQRQIDSQAEPAA